MTFFFFFSLVSVPVVSLPNGCNSFPPELIAKLERFETIYLWMDNDTSGQLAATKFVKKLGHGRCLLVKPLLSPSPSTFVPKDANEALLHNIDMIPMLENAKRMEDDRIQTYKDLKDLVLQLSDVNEEKGIGALSLPKFNDIIKGFREGELVPLSGPTGSG